MPDNTPVIERGTCHIVYAYDIGQSIDLSDCKRLIREDTRAVRFHHRYRAPNYFQFDPAPLRIRQAAEVLEVGSDRTGPEVDISLFHFGGVSVGYKVDLGAKPLTALVDLSDEASDCEPLLADSQRRVEQLIELIRTAVDRPELAPVVEDYSIFEIRDFRTEGFGREELLGNDSRVVAQILRGERETLSEQESSDALARSCSFGLGDLALIDWNAALVIDPEPEDVCSVLEFVNVQLLEMRHLDSQLDAQLDRAYDTLSRELWFGISRGLRKDLRQVGQMQVDSAILVERVHNGLKLLGDPYLARVYRMTAERFRLAEWNTGILRKIDTIESIYQKLHDRAATERMEVLEWIIIILIAVSILLPFFVPY